MSSGRGSDSRGSRGRSCSTSSTTPQLPPGSSERIPPELNSRHAAVVRAMLESPEAPLPRPSAPRPSAPPGPSAQQFPRPSGLFHVPDVRIPQVHRPATQISATSSGSTVASDPPPALYFPPLLPAIPDMTPEGVPIPEQPPRLLTPAEAYVYIPFVGMTLRRARVSLKTKEVSSTATSAAGTKNNV